MSFQLGDDYGGDSEYSEEENISDNDNESENEQRHAYGEESDDKEDGEERKLPEDNTGKRRVGTLIAVPHRKRKMIRSNVQALTSLASGLKELVSGQMKRHNATMEYEKEKEQRYLKFRAEEAQKNRDHEYRMALLFATANTTDVDVNSQASPDIGCPPVYHQMQRKRSSYHQTCTPALLKPNNTFSEWNKQGKGIPVIVVLRHDVELFKQKRISIYP